MKKIVIIFLFSVGSLPQANADEPILNDVDFEFQEEAPELDFSNLLIGFVAKEPEVGRWMISVGYHDWFTRRFAFQARAMLGVFPGHGELPNFSLGGAFTVGTRRKWALGPFMDFGMYFKDKKPKMLSHIGLSFAIFGELFTLKDELGELGIILEPGYAYLPLKDDIGQAFRFHFAICLPSFI